MKSKNIKKAIGLSVFRNSLYKGCSAGGISEKFEEVLIICDDGYIPVDMDNPPENLCTVIKVNVGGEYKFLVPFKPCPKGLTGWMAGGAYASSSDSRFAKISMYPLSIHDRAEKPW